MSASDSASPQGLDAKGNESLLKINSFAIQLLQQQTLDDLLWSMAENVGSLLGFQDCVIYLKEGDTLVQAASYSARDPELRDHRRDFRLHLGQGIVSTVAQSGIARIVDDTRQVAEYVADDFGGLSELAVPILFESRVIGVIDTESQHLAAYDEADKAMLEFVANIAASRIVSAQAERERRELLESLEAKNKELERFTYTVSHDLKSPLVTIQGFLGLLEKDVATGDTVRLGQDIDAIRSAANRMGKLLNDLLALSRIGRQLNPPEPVDLNELVREAVDLVAGRIQQRDVRLEIDDDLPEVFCDRQRLLMVWLNLIDNAVKFMGDEPNPRIEVGAQRRETETVCHVRDNGLGIGIGEQEQVFGLFDRLHREIEGTGIGLALVKRIVELHKGWVWVESEGTGSGSTFYFALPHHRGD